MSPGRCGPSLAGVSHRPRLGALARGGRAQRSRAASSAPRPWVRREPCTPVSVSFRGPEEDMLEQPKNASTCRRQFWVLLKTEVFWYQVDSPWPPPSSISGVRSRESKTLIAPRAVPTSENP